MELRRLGVVNFSFVIDNVKFNCRKILACIIY